MEYISGTPREQIMLFPEVVDDYISTDNPVRFIDAFVDSLDLKDLGFNKTELASTGRSPYNPATLLKLYIYGYLERIRASRRLERETHRNLELRWLLQNLQPDHKTISDFRKDNKTALRNVTRQFIILCKSMDLFGGNLVGIDGSKFRAVNSKDRNYTKKKLKAQIKQIDEDIESYLKELETNDDQDHKSSSLNTNELNKKIKSLTERLQRYQSFIDDIEQENIEQKSLTDSDSRLMKTRNGTNVCYNVQVAVDNKHKLIVENDVTNDANDRYNLSPIAIKAKETLGCETLEICADADYGTGSELKACEDNNIVPYVSLRAPHEQRSYGIPTSEYYRSKFKYDKQRDRYICPNKQVLPNIHTSERNGHKVSFYQNSSACNVCSARNKCTINKKQGRRIFRSEYEEYFEILRDRVAMHSKKVKERKSLCEHPFGTIKHWWSMQCFLTRGIEGVKTEFSLTTLAYNMKRVINIVGVNKMIEALA
jgi:transposase